MVSFSAKVNAKKPLLPVPIRNCAFRIQPQYCHPREGGGTERKKWIPAFFGDPLDLLNRIGQKAQLMVEIKNLIEMGLKKGKLIRGGYFRLHVVHPYCKV